MISYKNDSPVQHFTPRNSWGFEARKAFRDLPDGFRVHFANSKEGYEQDEIQVHLTMSMTMWQVNKDPKFEVLQLPGITDRWQAYVHARYHISSAKMRPEIYSFYTDIEHIVCTRGDLIRVTHDVPLWGVSSGRIVPRFTEAQCLKGNRR